MEIQPHRTWDVFDSTKTQDYMTCPRMYFYRYILGWRPEEPSIDLVFGSAWHKAMASLLEQGYSTAALTKAVQEFNTEFRKTFPNAGDDDMYAPKTPSNAIRGLAQYIITYNNDAFKVLSVEVAGTIPISETRRMHYRIDGVVRDPLEEKVYILEHKTGQSFSTSWQNQWSLKVQIGTYAHVLYCAYEPTEIAGVHINGFFPHNPPQIKKDGTPYANSKDNEFGRLRIAMPPHRMQVWLQTVNHWLSLLEDDMDRLDTCSSNDTTMTCFPMNTESCSKYRGCPYRDFCIIWPNPLQRCQRPPLGFIQEYWDPRDSEKDAKEIINYQPHGDDIG